MPPEQDSKQVNYEVGYARPPVQSRFKKGRTGNPKGRPRGSKKLLTMLHEGIEQKVSIQENGRRRKITKREAMLTQAINKATSGDLKSLQYLLPLILEADALAQARRAENNSSEYGQKMDLLTKAVLILRDLGVDLSLPKTAEQATAQIEVQGMPEETRSSR